MRHPAHCHFQTCQPRRTLQIPRRERLAFCPGPATIPLPPVTAPNNGATRPETHRVAWAEETSRHEVGIDREKRLTGRGEMPKETITTTHIDNGADDQRQNELLIAWGAKGDAPDTPDGWVNAGYAHMAISQDLLDGKTNPDDSHYVELNAAAMDHLIRTLKRIRRRTFDA